MTYAAFYAIAIGAIMLGQWALTILKGQVAGPEAGISGRGKTEMAFHWVAESATAILLILAGAGLLAGAGWGLTLFLVAAGMLVYTLINSPGFFAQKGKWWMVAFFGVLLVAAAFALLLVD